MNNFAARLKTARQAAGFTQKELATRAGLSQTTISDIERGRNEGSAEVATLAAILRVEALWLAEGKGPQALQGKAAERTLIDLEEHPDISPVKRASFKLHAGIHGYALEINNDEGPPVFFRKDWMLTNGYKPEKLVAIRVAGESMEPSLWDGDLVVVNLADTTPHDGEVFAVSYEGEPGIKRLRRQEGDWWLYSDNIDQRKFYPKRCTEEVQIIGRVIYRQTERI